MVNRRPPPLPSPHSRLLNDRRVVISGVVGGAVLLVLLGWLLFAPSTSPSFVGKWTAGKMTVDTNAPSPFGPFSISVFLKVALQGEKLSSSFEVGELGQYKYDWGGDDAGTIAANGPGSMIFTSDITHQSTVFSYLVTNPQSAASFATELGGRVGDSAIAITAPTTAQSVLLGIAQGREGEADRAACGSLVYPHTGQRHAGSRDYVTRRHT